MLGKFLPTDADWKDRFILRWALFYIAFLVVASVGFLSLLSDSSDVGFWRAVVSWILFASVMFGLIAVNRYFKRDGADEEGRRHLTAIRPQLVNASPPKVTIERGDTLADYRETIAGLFDGDRPGQTGVRDGLAEFREEWRAQTRRFPSLAVFLAYEAALMLVFAAIVAVPVEWWAGGESSSIDLMDALGWLAGALWTLATAFPAVDVILSLGAVAILSVGSILFEKWLTVVAILFVGSYLIVRLDRETETDLSRTLYPDRRQLARRTALWVSVLWIAGAAPALLHPVIGLVIATIVALAIGGHVTLNFVERIHDAGRQPPEDLSSPSQPLLRRAETAFEDSPTDVHRAANCLIDELETEGPGWRTPGLDYRVMAYLVVRKVWALLGLLCLPILLAYVALAFGTGAILEVVVAVATAPNQIRLPALACLVLAAAVVKRQYPEATAVLLEGSRRAWASSTVRGKAFARGVPLLAVVIGFGATWPFAAELGLGAQTALLFGMVAGVLARLGTLAWQATSYRFVDFSDRDRGHPRVVIKGFTIEDGDGNDLYIARVDGKPMAHRDRDALVEIVLSVARRRLEDGELPATFAGYYYDEVTRAGVVDIEMVGNEYRADIKTRVEATLREHDGELEVESMDSEMTEEYAEPAYRSAVRWLVEHGDVDVRRGKYVLH